MNQKRIKELREKFEAWHGSKDRTSDAYKYAWRLFKKTITKQNRKNYKGGGARV